MRPSVPWSACLPIAACLMSVAACHEPTSAVIADAAPPRRSDAAALDVAPPIDAEAPVDAPLAIDAPTQVDAPAPIDAPSPIDAPPGAQFSTLMISNDDALDGQVRFEATNIIASWTTSNATAVRIFEPVVATVACAAVPTDGWALIHSGPAMAAYRISSEDATDRCWLFTAAGSTDQSVVVALDIQPGISMMALPSSIPPSGGATVVAGSIRGAASLRVLARYLAANDAPLGESVRCDSADPAHPFGMLQLPSGSARCAATFSAADLPAGTARIKFVVTAVDSEGDARVETLTIAVTAT